MPIHKFIFWCFLLSLLFSVLATSCSTLPRNPVPVEKMDLAQVAGMPGVRAWAGSANPDFQRDRIESVRQEPPGMFPRATDGSITYRALSISGGGSNGAYSEGFLNGWTRAGNRPIFKMVTGISTGALIAPFAFVGSEFDERLKTYYTNIQDEDVYERRPFLSTIHSNSLMDTTPLARLIAESVNQEVIQEVAEAHLQGRRLYIGTANLDSDRLAIWNMGKIANSGHPNAVALFHKIMLASASIPVLFPPVFIDVEVDGNTYDEMHVDGGTRTQLFFYGAVLNLRDAAREALGQETGNKIKGILYIIRNGMLVPDPEPIPINLLNIARRSGSTMINAIARGDFYRVGVFAKRDNIKVRYTGIPGDYEKIGKEQFDPEDMKRLYEVGYQMAMSDNPWGKSIPGLD